MTHPSERMSEAEIVSIETDDLGAFVMLSSNNRSPIRYAIPLPVAEAFRTDLAAANEQIDTLRTQLAEAVATWTPASEHSGLFEDGESYLVRVPVINQRYNREFMEYHIITATCDSETPVTFNDQNGDTWCAWDWEDVEAYIKLDTLSRLTTDADASGEGVGK